MVYALIFALGFVCGAFAMYARCKQKQPIEKAERLTIIEDEPKEQK